jgi:ssDNA-binding Zn-finger/Zn-ribbon topoisomerase 1
MENQKGLKQNQNHQTIISLNNEIVSVTPIVCKNCGSEAVMKWGKYKQVTAWLAGIPLEVARLEGGR